MPRHIIIGMQQDCALKVLCETLKGRRHIFTHKGIWIPSFFVCVSMF